MHIPFKCGPLFPTTAARPLPRVLASVGLISTPHCLNALSTHQRAKFTISASIQPSAVSRRSPAAITAPRNHTRRPMRRWWPEVTGGCFAGIRRQLERRCYKFFKLHCQIQLSMRLSISLPQHDPPIVCLPSLFMCMCVSACLDLL